MARFFYKEMSFIVGLIIVYNDWHVEHIGFLYCCSAIGLILIEVIVKQK